jgi:chromate transporter
MVGALAWAYVRYGALPEVNAVMYGVKPVVIAVVAVALWRLGKTAVKTRLLGVLGVASAAAVALGVNELAVLGGAGVLYGATKLQRVPPALAIAPIPGLGTLFLTFLKIGSVLFGSGYVLLAFLRADFVEHLHWLTESQVLDAVSVGQITPGPVFTTATFIGYVLGGAPGAVLATLGIFLPAFVFVALSGPLVPWMRKHAFAGGLLDGINVASMALMAVVTWQLGRASIIDLTTAVVAVVAVGALVLRVNSLWMLLAGAIVGYVAWVR